MCKMIYMPLWSVRLLKAFPQSYHDPNWKEATVKISRGRNTFSAFWCIRSLNSTVHSFINFSLTTTVSLKTIAEACLLNGLITC